MHFTAIRRRLPVLSALIAAAGLLASTTRAQTYKIDDGVPGYSLSYQLPDDFCWLNVLDANGTETITSIEIMFGDIPDGTPVTLCLWRDLSGFGDVSTGLLLSSTTSVVRNSNQPVFNTYYITPATVTGKFFVGAFLSTDAPWSPARMDPNTPTLQRAWFCAAYGPGTFDPTFLGNWQMYSVSTIGVPGVFMVRANGSDGPTPSVYCTSKVDSAGCSPTVGFNGTSSASAGSGFTVSASSVLNQKNGQFFYGLSGQQLLPFGGGTLCVRPPHRRTPLQNSGGAMGAPDCSGSYAIDFNAWIAGGADPALVPGVAVDGQFWSRDPGFAPPDNVGLTQGAHFGIGP